MWIFAYDFPSGSFPFFANRAGSSMPSAFTTGCSYILEHTLCRKTVCMLKLLLECESCEHILSEKEALLEVVRLIIRGG